MSMVTAYFSHTIRGKKGIKATLEDMDANCVKAQVVADWIRVNIPNLKLYVPAEHEDFVQRCYTEKLLTEQQILAVDCQILAVQDLHIVLMEDGWLGGGIAVEIDAANKAGVPIFYVTGVYDLAELVPIQQKISEIKAAEKTPDPTYIIDSVELPEDYREGLIDISWGSPGPLGFGHISFDKRDGKIHCSSETMSREFVRQVLDKLVDMAIFESYDFDPVRYEDGAWYWWDETRSGRTGPYDTQKQAEDACAEYCKRLFEEENNGRET